MSKHLFDDGEEFYNLMQQYRHMPLTRFKEIIDSYEEVEHFIDSEIRRNIKEALDKLQLEDVKDYTEWNVCAKEVKRQIAQIKKDRGIN